MATLIHWCCLWYVETINPCLRSRESSMMNWKAAEWSWTLQSPPWPDDEGKSKVGLDGTHRLNWIDICLFPTFPSMFLSALLRMKVLDSQFSKVFTVLVAIPTSHTLPEQKHISYYDIQEGYRLFLHILHQNPPEIAERWNFKLQHLWSPSYWLIQARRIFMFWVQWTLLIPFAAWYNEGNRKDTGGLTL